MTTPDLNHTVTPEVPIGRPPQPDTPLTELVSGIISDAKTLVRQQADMLKVELHEEFDELIRASEFGSMAIVCTTVGVLSLTTALAFVLHEQLHYAMWASWGIVGVLFMIGGLCLGWASYIRLERISPLPNKTANSFKRLFTWKKK